MGGESVTRTGKKLELGQSFSYVGPERGFPGSSGLGEPKGGGQGETPSRGQEGANPRGVWEDGGAQIPSREGLRLSSQWKYIFFS